MNKVPTWARVPLTILAIAAAPFLLLPAIVLALVAIVYMNIWHPEKCGD